MAVLMSVDSCSCYDGWAWVTITSVFPWVVIAHFDYYWQYVMSHTCVFTEVTYNLPTYRQVLICPAHESIILSNTLPVLGVLLMSYMVKTINSVSYYKIGNCAKYVVLWQADNVRPRCSLRLHSDVVWGLGTSCVGIFQQPYLQWHSLGVWWFLVVQTFILGMTY